MFDAEEINERWREMADRDVWAQLIIKEPNDSVERILAAPRTGTYQLSADGELVFLWPSYDWHQVTSENECFFLRVYGPGDYRFKGADLGILITKGRMQTAAGLTSGAGVTSQASVPITSASRSGSLRPARRWCS